jgi:ATP-binding cassette subfamily F protein 3
MAFDKQVLFSQVNLTVTNGQRVALIGPNGEGKTTLLRLIAGELQPTAGRIHLGPGLKLGYMAQEQEILDLDSTPYETIAAVLVEQGRTQGEIRQFLHQFLFAVDEVFVKIGYLSLGERVRLMLALLVAQACNFLLMDEPLNYLDIQSRERFEQALLQFPGTVMAVVHDRAFIERFATDVWEIRAKKLRFR